MPKPTQIPLIPARFSKKSTSMVWKYFIGGCSPFHRCNTSRDAYYEEVITKISNLMGHAYICHLHAFLLISLIFCLAVDLWLSLQPLPAGALLSCIILFNMDRLCNPGPCSTALMIWSNDNYPNIFLLSSISSIFFWNRIDIVFQYLDVGIDYFLRRKPCRRLNEFVVILPWYDNPHMLLQISNHWVC